MNQNNKTTLQWALGYINIGWYVVPLKPGTKQPASWLVPNGVHGATCDPELARKWWGASPDCGIGIAVLPSKLVCVDIDPRNGGFETMERLEGEHGALTSDVLQFTGGGGEHRIFSSEMVAKLPGTMGAGVDLKSDGYFCAEPSIHPNGTAYGWEASSDPQEGSVPSILPGWVRDLARAPSTVQAGNVAATAQSGSRFVSPDQVLELREALSFIDCDDYNEWVTVGHALRSAGAAGFGLWDVWSQRSEKYDPAMMGKKWRSFAPTSVNWETVFFRARELGWVNPLGKVAQAREQALQALADQENQVRVYVPAQVQAEVAALQPFPVPMLDEACHWICRTQGIAHGVAVQMAVISLAGLAASRLYVSEHGDGAHLYQLISAPSVGDLLPLHRAIGQVVRECGMRKLLREQRFTSQTGFYRTLMRAPATLWMAAEWGTMTAFAKRQSSGLVDHVLNLMVGAYVQPDICLDNIEDMNGFKSAAGIDDDMPMIRKPALSMLAFTSETMLSASFAAGEIGRGAVEQLMFHNARMVNQGEMQAEAAPAWLVDKIRAIRKLPAFEGADLDLASLFNGNAQLLPTQTVVRFEAKPEEHYPTFDAMCECSRAARPLGNGARTMLKRLAVTLAVWENHHEPVVTRTVLDWCAQFVAQRLAESLAALHFNGGSDDGKTSMYQTLLQHVAQAGTTGTTQTQAVRAIYRFRALASAKRDELVAQLIEDGEVVEQRNSNGKGTRLFVAAVMTEAPKSIAKHVQNTQNTQIDSGRALFSPFESTTYEQNTQNTTTIR